MKTLGPYPQMPTPAEVASAIAQATPEQQDRLIESLTALKGAMTFNHASAYEEARIATVQAFRDILAPDLPPYRGEP